MILERKAAINYAAGSVGEVNSRGKEKAAIYGFYCGYHGAMCIVDEVMPLPFGSAMNTRKTIAMANWFGFLTAILA